MSITYPADWELARAVLTAWNDSPVFENRTKRAILYGPPGTGKTTAGMTFGTSDAIKIECTEETSVAQILGHFMPVGNAFVFMLGPAPLAMMHGRRLVVDEFDKLAGFAMDIFRHVTAMDDAASLTIPDPNMAGMTEAEMVAAILAGDGLLEVRPATGYQVVATMNGEPEDLEEPISDRFATKIRIDNVNPEALAYLPADLQDTARNSAVAPADRRIGIRAWSAFADLREALANEGMAARAIFRDRASDVLDALNMARGGAWTAQPKPKVKPQQQPTNTDPAKPQPYFWQEVTGKRGRPGRVKCDAHGALKMNKSSELADGLYCECGARCAKPGEYVKMIGTPDASKPGKMKWEPAS
jgi:hypothetical protein